MFYAKCITAFIPKSFWSFGDEWIIEVERRKAITFQRVLLLITKTGKFTYQSLWLNLLCSHL